MKEPCCDAPCNPGSRNTEHFSARGITREGPRAQAAHIHDVVRRVGAQHFPRGAGALGIRVVVVAGSAIGLVVAAVLIAAAFLHRGGCRANSRTQQGTLGGGCSAASGDRTHGGTGDPRLLDPDGRPLPTKDGWVCVSANTDAQAFGFFRAVGRPELITDPRFSSVSARHRNVKAYFAIRIEALKDRTTAEWLEIFDAADVPAMPYHTLETLLEDPHLAEAGFFEWKDHPTEGRIRNMRVPNRLSGGVRADYRPAPKLGADSREVLAEAGYDAATIDRMIAEGVTLAR